MSIDIVADEFDYFIPDDVHGQLLETGDILGQGGGCGHGSESSGGGSGAGNGAVRAGDGWGSPEAYDGSLCGEGEIDDWSDHM